MKREKLWTKEFIFTSIANFVLFLSMYLLLVTMASYVIEAYGTSTSIAGLVASIFIIGALFGRLFAGRYMEKTGTKKMLIIGIILFVIMAFFYFLDIGIYTLMVIRVLQGIATGLATTATGTIVSQVIPPNRHGEGIGYFSMSIILSTAIGPLIGVGLMNLFNYNSIFVFSLVMGAISLIPAIAIKEPEIEPEHTEQHDSNASGFLKLSNYFEVNAVPIAIVTLIVGFAYSGILSFITTYSTELGLDKGGGFYFFVYAVVVLLTRPFTGKIMDVRGANSIIYPSIVFFAFGMIIISQANSDFVFLLAAVFIGLGYGNFQSCTQALAIKVTPIHRMGLANSTYFIFLDLALGLGPLIIGLFISFIGFRGMYLTLAIVIIFGLFAYHSLHGKKDKKLTQLAVEDIRKA